MKISTKGRYIITFMVDLAREYDNNSFISLKTIANKENISIKYLEKLIANYKDSDYFITSRGSDGGYRLKYPPEHYKISDILIKAEGNLDVTQCTSNDYNCPKKKQCSTFKLWYDLSQTIITYLSSKTLKDYL